MAISIGSNIAAQQALRQLARSSFDLGRSFTRLASGLRINRAADDAAGLAVATGLNAQARVYGQAVRNLNDGLSYLNIADGALQQLTDITTRQIELAQQAANGSFTAAQRRSLHTEANKLSDEYNRIILSTKFNGRSLFDPLNGTLSLQAGFGVGGSLTIQQNEQIKRVVGTGSYQDAVELSGTSTISAVSLDYDGDGHIDLAAITGSSNITVRFGMGDGTFTAAVAVGTTPGQALVVADENADGIDDLLFSESATVQVLRGNSSRTFSAASTGVAANSFFNAGDFNGDGRLDILGTSGVNYTFALGQAGGGYTSPVLAGLSVGALQIADFDGDGDDDVFGGTGVFNFTGASFQRIGTHTLSRAVIGDLNNDGRADLVGVTGGNLVVALGNGDGTFGSNISLGAVGGSATFAIHDLNGDGRRDILRTDDGDLITYLQSSSGTFNTAFTLETEQSSSSLIGAFGDYDEDGSVDLLSFSFNDGIYQYMGIGAYTSEVSQVDLLSSESALTALEELQARLASISAERGSLGSFQSRIQTALAVVSATGENLRSAESRIIDADVAQESALALRSTIAQQAGALILAQANQQPALALLLLRNGPSPT